MTSPARHLPILDVRHVKKTYVSRARTVEAIGDLDFTVNDGEFVCIVGPSGAGKTTLLRCIAGLLDRTSGDVVFEGSTVSAPPKDMAVVFQEYGRSVFPWLTVRGNIELPLKERRMPTAVLREKVDNALSAVGLAEAGDAYPWQLSGGMQQRAAIARAIAYEPKLLIMDEPFAAVDAQTRADLEDLVRDLWKRLKVTVLFVTHDIDEAVYLGERVLVLSSSPTIVLEEVQVDLPFDRDQLTTRMLPRFATLRAHVYERIQEAKRGSRTMTPTTVERTA